MRIMRCIATDDETHLLRFPLILYDVADCRGWADLEKMITESG